MRITLVVLAAMLLSGCVVVDPYGYRAYHYHPYYYRR